MYSDRTIFCPNLQQFFVDTAITHSLASYRMVISIHMTFQVPYADRIVIHTNELTQHR